MTNLPGSEGLTVASGVVLPEWIDVNNHMNVAYYVLAFDLAIDKLWHRLGITDDYIRTQRGSTFAVENHVTWQRELKLDDPYIITSQLIGYDEKRIHQFQRMYHGNDHYLAATAEWMNLHVSLETRRVSPWPAGILAELETLASEQRHFPLPAEAGKRMHLKQSLMENAP